MTNWLFAVAWVVVFPIAAMAADNSSRCTETGIRVAGWSATERDRVCGAAAAAIAFLRAAGVAYHADDLMITRCHREATST